MSDSTKYNPLVAWRILVEYCYQLTRETENNPATYRIPAIPLDNNDINAGEKAAGYAFTDNIGTPYKIISVGANTVDVEDVFRTGYCPTTGKEGWIHKSAYKGYSYLLPASLFWNLHPLAASNNNKYSMSILWANDPNGRRIPFTDVLMPEIADYRGILTDSEGIEFSPSEDYGQNPQFEIWQLTENGKYSKLGGSSEPQITRSEADGLIDSVLFSGTGELMTGYILIKN